MAIRETSRGEWSLLSVLLSMVGILLVVAAGEAIPMPGLEPAFLESLIASEGSSRGSILALGSGAVLQAFALGQLFVLAFPKLDGRRPVVIAVRVIVLLIALSQAYGIMLGLAGSSQPLLDDSFPQWIVIVSLLGGAAVTLFLSERLRLPLLGIGLWLVWLFPGLVTLPNEVASTFDALRTGMGGLTEPLIGLGYCVVGLGLCVLAGRMLVADIGDVGGGVTDRSARRDLLCIMVWPPILAAVSASYVLIPLALLMPELIGTAEWLRPFIMVMTAFLIPVFIVLYRRRFMKNGFVLRPLVVTVLAGVEILVVTGGMMLAQTLTTPLLLNGTMLLVIAAIWFAVVDVARPKLLRPAPA